MVDNYGDIGVTWRLARQLNLEHAIQVRLIVDNLASFRMLAPGIDDSRTEQDVEGISVVAWRDPLNLSGTADLVIEAFGCELPSTYVAEMACRPLPPVWINLEYLSAEAWIDTHHLLPSPHRVHALTKYFFFPGFTLRSGGLIREKSVQVPPQSARTACAENGLNVFVFAYENCPAEALLAAIQRHGQRVCVRTPEGPLASKLKHWRASHGENGLEAATVLEFEVLPFVSQIEFDGLLNQHDMLFVRGEDSLVRAIWAAKPFVWQIYPQSEHTHWRKLDAFLELYCEGLSGPTEAALRELWRAWNASDEAAIDAAWGGYLAQWDELCFHARSWSGRQAKHADLVSNLLSFYRKTTKI